MTPCATYLSKKVCLIIWVHKDLENSIVEFTLYLNNCVCVQKVMSLKTKVIHQMFWQKHIIYIFLVTVASHLQNRHKNTGTKIFITEIVSLKQNN